MSAAERDLERWLGEARRWSEDELKRRVAPPASHPEALHEAIHYALFGGGKRLRPALVRLVCESLGGSPSQAAPPAVAVELVHTYSLVHDDLPCMDDDELRRGRPTVHVRYGEAVAILVGDALLTAAFGELSRGESLAADRALACARVLADAAGSGGMVGGQTLDLDPARGADLEAVQGVHRLKTAALISAAAEMGAVAAGAELRAQREVRRYGTALGMLFQAVDDLLDVTGDARTLGKTPGKDARQEKATLIAALGLDGARAEAARLAAEARAAAAELGWGEIQLPVLLVDHFLDRSA